MIVFEVNNMNWRSWHWGNLVEEICGHICFILQTCFGFLSKLQKKSRSWQIAALLFRMNFWFKHKDFMVKSEMNA